MNPLWSCVPAEQLLWEEWESDTTLYDRATGETHLLTPLPAELLRILQQAPQTTSALASELARRCDTEDDAEWQRKTMEMLASLESLGLVQRGRS